MQCSNAKHIYSEWLIFHFLGYYCFRVPIQFSSKRLTDLLIRYMHVHFLDPQILPIWKQKVYQHIGGVFICLNDQVYILGNLANSENINEQCQTWSLSKKRSQLRCFQENFLRASNDTTNIYLFKVNNKNTTKRCEICSKLTIKTPERRHWRHWRSSSVFIVNFEHVSNLFLVSLLLTLNN